MKIFNKRNLWLAFRIVIYLWLVLILLGLRHLLTWGDAAYRPGFFYDLVGYIEKVAVFIAFLPKVIVGYLSGCKEFACDVSYIYPKIVSIKVLWIRFFSSFVFNLVFQYFLALVFVSVVKKFKVPRVNLPT